jgi:hypothetical protein
VREWGGAADDRVEVHQRGDHVLLSGQQLLVELAWVPVGCAEVVGDPSQVGRDLGHTKLSWGLDAFAFLGHVDPSCRGQRAGLRTPGDEETNISTPGPRAE